MHALRKKRKKTGWGRGRSGTSYLACMDEPTKRTDTAGFKDCSRYTAVLSCVFTDTSDHLFSTQCMWAELQMPSLACIHTMEQSLSAQAMIGLSCKLNGLRSRLQILVCTLAPHKYANSQGYTHTFCHFSQFGC